MKSCEVILPLLLSFFGNCINLENPVHDRNLLDLLRPFNPEVFSSKSKSDIKNYVNDPVEIPNNIEEYLSSALNLTVSIPNGLLHESHPLGTDSVMGLAAYPKNIRAFKRIVGSLRSSGYDGHIILGVSSLIPENELEYLKSQQVTSYKVEFVECDESINLGGKVKGAIRGKCAKGLETLKLEWARYELARQWLIACKTCTGWSMVMDTRDIFFQDHPFRSLGSPVNPPQNLLFVEEIAPHSSPDPNPTRSFISANFRNAAHILPCYGKEKYDTYALRPVLCSGTVIGNREGMYRFLSVLVYEFHNNNKKSNQKCKSPTTTDQWTMNWLYYNGYFGLTHQTKTLPWGTGPVLTVGKPCIGADKKSGAKDLVKFNSKGLFVNIHEYISSSSSNFSVSPVVHQFDRCGSWMADYFNNLPELFKDFLELRKHKSKFKKHAAREY